MRDNIKKNFYVLLFLTLFIDIPKIVYPDSVKISKYRRGKRYE